MMMRLDSIREAIRLALDQLRANKFRSAITIFGVVVGVATVMAMSAMIVGIRTEAFAGLAAAGPRNFMVARYNVTEVRLANNHGPPWGTNPKITVQEARRIEALPSVRQAIVDIDRTVELEAMGQTVSNVQLSADSEGWQEFTIGGFTAGHNFLASDVRASRPLAVISKPLADDLFGALDPVNRTIRIDGRPFHVVGVFDVAGNIFGDVARHVVVVPYTAALKHLKVWDGMLTVLVVTAGDVGQERAIDDVIATMRSARGLRPGEPNDFSIVKQEELLALFDRLTGVFFAVMLGLSSIALLVGGVGVIAIMMISVTERTREIGIRKAVGATRREILWQFLFEAATLTLIGGAVGMVLGGSAAYIVQATTPIPATVPVWAIVAALSMAAIAGILFGLWPAWRASRMDPVEALRYE